MIVRDSRLTGVILLVWLLRMEDGEEDIYNDLLAKFLALPPSIETKVCDGPFHTGIPD